MSGFDDYRLAYTPAKETNAIGFAAGDGPTPRNDIDEDVSEVIPRAPVKKFGSPSPFRQQRRKPQANDLHIAPFPNNDKCRNNSATNNSMPIIFGSNVVVNSPDPMSKYNS